MSMKHLKWIKKRKVDEKKTNQFLNGCVNTESYGYVFPQFSFVSLSNVCLLPSFPLHHSSTQASHLRDRCHCLSLWLSICSLSLTLTSSPNTPSSLRPRNFRCFFLILYVSFFFKFSLRHALYVRALCSSQHFSVEEQFSYWLPSLHLWGDCSESIAM